MKYLPIAVVIVVALAGGAYFLIDSSTEDAERDEAHAVQTAELQKDLDETSADRARLESELSEARERIKQLEADAATAEFEPEVTSEVAEEPMEPEAEESTEDKDLSLNDIRAKLRENPAASVQLKALSEMMYSDFLNAVEMDAATKSDVRDLLADSYLETAALTQYGLQDDDATWSDVRAWTLEERAILDEELRGRLDADAYAAWSTYAADIDARQLDSTLRNQIRTIASGLTPDNFELVMGVAVQQFRAEQIALEQSNEPFTLEENVNYQLRAMDAMRAQLQGVLPEDQFAELQNFLTFGENALSAQLGRAGR